MWKKITDKGFEDNSSEFGLWKTCGKIREFSTALDREVSLSTFYSGFSTGFPKVFHKKSQSFPQFRSSRLKTCGKLWQWKYPPARKNSEGGRKSLGKTF